MTASLWVSSALALLNSASTSARSTPSSPLASPTPSPICVSNPAELVAGYRAALGNLDALHHLITGHVISIDGDQATCAANMQGTHVLANASGGPMWTVGGRHDYRLERTADGWRIASSKLTRLHTDFVVPEAG